MASLAETDPVTTPVEAFGVPTVVVVVGTVFSGAMGTATDWETEPPRKLLTVMVTVSVVTVAPVFAAACRAVAVGV